MSSYRYRDSHDKDKAVLRSSYRYYENPQTCKNKFLYWDRALTAIERTNTSDDSLTYLVCQRIIISVIVFNCGPEPLTGVYLYRYAGDYFTWNSWYDTINQLLISHNSLSSLWHQANNRFNLETRSPFVHCCWNSNIDTDFHLMRKTY